MKRTAEFPANVRQLVYARAGGRCELCNSTQVEGIHHRQRRAPSNCVASNALLLCYQCHHGKIHENPSAAYTMGWLVHHWDDYHQVPVWLKLGSIMSRWILLDDGTLDVTPIEEADTGELDPLSDSIGHDQRAEVTSREGRGGR